MDPSVKLLTSVSPGCPEDRAFMKDKPYISEVLSAGLWWVDNTQEKAGEHSDSAD
jgi:hypothetical protein